MGKVSKIQREVAKVNAEIQMLIEIKNRLMAADAGVPRKPRPVKVKPAEKASA